MTRPPLVLLAALGIACLPPALAFESAPPGSSVHDDITAIVRDAGWPEAATEALQQAVREPDYKESEYDPEIDDLGRLDATEHYRSAHHCDREPGTSDRDAFAQATGYVQQQRLEALNQSAAGQPEQAMAALGRALHVVQDCYSHSNVVDLPPDAQRDFEDAILHGGPAVEGLRLTSYEPGADEPESPAGDEYTHKDFAKDGPDTNEEAGKPSVHDANATKFEAARELARLATIFFVQEFVHELEDPQRDALLGVEGDGTNVPGGGEALPGDRKGAPGPGALVVLVAVASLAGIRRARRPGN